MNIGHTLLADTKVFSPWFPREADNAVFTFEQIKLTTGATFTVNGQHCGVARPTDPTAPCCGS